MKLEFVKNRKTSEVNNIYNFIDYENNVVYYPLFEASIKKLEAKYSKIPEDLFSGKEAEGIPVRTKDTVALKKLLVAHNEHFKDSRDYICVCREKLDFDEELTFIFIYGAYTERKIYIISDMNSLPALLSSSTTRSVMVFSRIEQVELNRFISLCSRNRNIMAGYIPYEDKYNLNFLIAKLIISRNAEYSKKHLMINRVSVPEETCLEAVEKDYEFRYYPKPYCTMDNLLEEMLNKGSLLEFNYLSHCRECVIFLNDFYLCGRTEKEKTKSRDTYQHTPCCFFNEEQCIVKHRKGYEASRLNADVVFLNGCKLGDLNKSLVPYEYTIISNLIDNNAVSIITSPTIKVGQLAENILAHNLLKYGYTEGEKLGYINDFLEYSQIEEPIYFLIGDPLFSARKGCSRKNSVIVTGKDNGNGNYLLEVVGIKGETMIEVALEDIKQGQEVYIEDISVLPTVDDLTAQGIYFFIAPERTGCSRRLMIFSKYKLEIERIKIKITGIDEIGHRVQDIRENMDNIQFYINNFVLDNALKGCIQDLQHNTKAIYPLLKEYRYKYHSLIKLDNIIRRIEKKTNKIYEDIFEAIVSYTANKLDNYHEKICEKRFKSKEEHPQSFCISCKGEERCYPYTLYTITKDYKRTNYKCMNCGMIRDVPDDMLTIESIGVPRFTSEGTLCERVRITNIHDRAVFVNIACICIHTKDVEISQSSNRERLLPGEAHEFEFTLKPLEGLKKHYYIFSFYIMAGGKFYYFSKIISYV